MPYNIITIGESLWDVFPDEPRFGRAPANCACSTAELGQENACVKIASAVGDDDIGRRAIEALTARGVQTEDVQRSGFPTGRVDVKLDEAGAATYQFAENCAWDHLSWNRDLAELADSCHAVCFGPLGLLAGDSLGTINRNAMATAAYVCSQPGATMPFPEQLRLERAF